MNAIHARSQLRYWPTREVEPTIITGPLFAAVASRHLAVSRLVEGFDRAGTHAEGGRSYQPETDRDLHTPAAPIA